MWDKMGDGYKKIGDNTTNGALKQKATREYVRKSKLRQVGGEMVLTHRFLSDGGGKVQLESKYT